MARSKGLGRGIDALIPIGSQKLGRDGQDGNGSGLGLRNLDVKAITPNRHQPRIHFDQDGLTELSASIRAVGVLQPILVRPTTGDVNSFELIAGERRWRAAKLAGLTTIPAIVRETDEVASVEQALIENLHRQDLTPLEEAAAYKQLLDDFSMTHEKISEKVGKTRSAVTNSLRLLSLPPEIQQLLADGRLSGGHARALLSVTEKTKQIALAKQCANDGWTVRAVEEAVRLSLGKATQTDKTDGSTNNSTTKNSKNNKPAGSTLPPAGILELQKLLSEHLSTKVEISGNGGHGKVVIEFADLNDLERIYRAMVENS